MVTASVLPLAAPPRTRTARALDFFERVGNRFPDPVVLFLVALALTWLASSVLSSSDFGLTDPRTGQPSREIIAQAKGLGAQPNGGIGSRR